MNYNVKVKRGAEERVVPPCDSYSVKTVSPESVAAQQSMKRVLIDKEGTAVEPHVLDETGKPTGKLLFGPTEPGVYFEILRETGSEMIVLPRDGDAIYVTNSGGKTVDSYHWPLRKPKAAVSQMPQTEGGE